MLRIPLAYEHPHRIVLTEGIIMFGFICWVLPVKRRKYIKY